MYRMILNIRSVTFIMGCSVIIYKQFRVIEKRLQNLTSTLRSESEAVYLYKDLRKENCRKSWPKLANDIEAPHKPFIYYKCIKLQRSFTCSI